MRAVRSTRVVAAKAPEADQGASAASAASAVAVPDTRQRILQLAWEGVASQGDDALSLVALARRAGVSRQTLYLLFGSRAGLLLAMVAQRDAQSQVGPRLARARAAGAPREVLAPYLRVWFDYLPQVFPVARALIATASAGDSDARTAWDSRMALLRAGLLQLTQALADSGALRPPWTPAAAADWIVSQTHVDAWQHLVVEAGWPPEQAIDRVLDTLHDTLLTRG